MITIKYNGRTGNRMFQYALGRILAQELNYTLNAESIPFFPNTCDKVIGASYTYNNPLFLTNHLIPLKELLDNKPKRHIVLNGFFCNYCYYEPYKENIKKWFKINYTPNYMPEKNDLIVHIRLTDGQANNMDLPYSFYKQLFSQTSSPIYIITDEITHNLITKLQKEFNCTILTKPTESFKGLNGTDINAKIRESTLNDLAIMINANNIVMSQSTYSWWGAFLSEATKIYGPIPQKGFLSRKEINLYIKEPRYEWIKV